MKSSGKRLKLGVILSYAYSIAQIVVNLLYVPILLHDLGANEYGVYQLVGALISYMNIFSLMFQGATTRFYCERLAKNDMDGARNVLGVSRRIYHLLSIIAAVVGVACVFGFGYVYRNVMTSFQALESSIMIIALVLNLIVVMNNSIYVSVINAHERFYFIKGLQLTTVIIQPVAIIVLISFWPYAIVVTTVQVIINMICAIAQRIYARKVLLAKAHLKGDYKYLYKEIIKFSSGIVLALVADQVFWKSNQLILGYDFGMWVVAVYGIAMQLQMVYMALGTTISNVFMPRISILYHGENSIEQVSNLFTRVGRLSTYPLLLVFTGFVLFGQSFIKLWVGNAYDEAYFIALAIFAPLSIDLVQNIGLTILQVTNKYTFRGMTYFAVAAMNIVLVVLIAPVYGALGAAVCSGLLMFLISGPVMNCYYKQRVGLDITSFWKNVLRVAMPLALYCGLSDLLLHATNLVLSSWLSLLFSILIYTVGYALVAFCLSMNMTEKQTVLDILRLRRRI